MCKLLISSSVLLFRNNLNEICSKHFNTILTNSGSDTMDKLFKEKPEIIFMDCNYNDIDSLELIKKVINHNPHILIYFFVGSLNKKESNGATKLGIMDICRKPVQNITIEQILKKILKNHSDKIEQCQNYYKEKYPENLEEMVFVLESDDTPKEEIIQKTINDEEVEDIDILDDFQNISFEFNEEGEEQPTIENVIDFEEDNNELLDCKETNIIVNDEEKTKEITQYITKELAKLLECKKDTNKENEINLEKNLNKVQENITTSINKEINKLLNKKQEVDINGVVLEINKNFKEYEQRILAKLNNKNNSIEEIDKLLKSTNQNLNTDLQNLFFNYNKNLIIVLEDILMTNQKLVEENKLLIKQYNNLLSNQDNSTQMILKELTSIKLLMNNQVQSKSTTFDTKTNIKTDIKQEKVVLEKNDEYNKLNNETNDTNSIILEDKPINEEDSNTSLVFEFDSQEFIDEETNNQEIPKEENEKLPIVQTSEPLIKPSVYNVFQDIPVKEEDDNLGLIHFDDEPTVLPEEQNKKIGLLKSLFSKKD